MKKAVKIYHWFAAIYTLVFLTMWTIGIVYQTPDESIYTRTLMVMMCAWVPIFIVWCAALGYDMVHVWDD